MRPLPLQSIQNLRAPARVRGLSIVELMVSITIGLVLLSGMTILFVNQSRTQEALDRSSRMIDNGRYALKVLADDLQLAGFYAELGTIPGVGALPGVCDSSAAALKTALPIPVQGVNDIAASTVSTCVTNAKPGTDILVIRRAATTSIAAPATTSTPYLQVAACRYQTNKYTLGTSGFTWLQKDCTSNTSGSVAEVRQMLVHIYFIDNADRLNVVELDSNGVFQTTALVEGIEELQLQYGRDTDSNAVVDAADDCAACTATDWSNVLDVTVSLMARNLETTTGHKDTNTYTVGGKAISAKNDGYKRHVFSQLVRLTNPADRRSNPT